LQQGRDALDDRTSQHPRWHLARRSGYRLSPAEAGFDREPDRVEHCTKRSPPETRFDQEPRRDLPRSRAEQGDGADARARLQNHTKHRVYADLVMKTQAPQPRHVSGEKRLDPPVSRSTDVLGVD